MKIKSSNLLLLLALITISAGFYACVPARQFDDLKVKNQTCQDENTNLKSENQKLTTQVTELNSSISSMRKDIDELVRDTTNLGKSYRRQSELYHELNRSYDNLLSNNERLLAGNTAETRKLIADLDIARLELQKKEDELKKDSISLAEREKSLRLTRDSLKDKEMKVNELQAILYSSDSIVTALKKTVTDALMGYQNNGLTINERNGRVYVSMEEQLLFASGSTDVEKRGAEALRDLAKVLEKNKDINIMVEGHTDNVPISGTLPSGAKDNWELSVLRATAVVKIILKNSSLDPVRISAAGKGPYQPLDPASTTEARRKNRRTEIILTPKLDELIKMLAKINSKK